MTAFVIPNALQITTRQAKYNFASFLSRDTTYDVIYNIWRLARPHDTTSYDGPISGSSGSLDVPPSESALGVGGGTDAGSPDLLHRATRCACGREGKHFTETVLESVLPGTPDRMHNLIFASGFIKDFMRVDQKLQGSWSVFFFLVLTMEANSDRYPNIGLDTHLFSLKAPLSQHVVHPTARLVAWPEANQMRADRRGGAL